MAERVVGRTSGRWLDVKQAAEELDISSDAVRKRIARGTLCSAKGEDGSVKVWLDGADEELHADQPSILPPIWTATEHRLDDLLEAKDEALRDLRHQLEHMCRESERKVAIIMQMAQANATLVTRVPELEAASKLRESPVTASEGEGMEDDGAPEFQEPVDLRSWWRRVLGV